MITEERLAALEAQMAALVEPPTEYYTSRYSGEEIDKGIDGALQLGGASTPQGAIAALGAGVRPKLNINPFFRVNQRGKSSYTVNGYTVDGWKMGANTATLDVLSDGVKVTLNQAPSNDVRLLHQIIEDPQSLIGKTVIAAFYVTAVTGAGFRCGFRANSGTITYSYADITQPGLYTALFTVPSGCTELLLTTFARANTPNGQSMTIHAATAEIGKNQTLAYEDEDGTLQFLEHPDPLEILKCERYQQVILPEANRNTVYVGTGLFNTNSEARIFVPYPVPLRTRPSLSFNGNLSVTDGSSPYTVSIINLEYSSVNGASILVKTNAVSAGGHPAMLRIDNDATGRFILDANL